MSELMSSPNECPKTAADWKAIVAKYQQPSHWRALWQIVNSIGSYALLWCLLYVCLQTVWWLAIPLTILGGGLLIRTFIIFHDCAHGSYFKHGWANGLCGFICGVLTLTPYQYWRWQHGRHHATSGDLDRRGIGDVWTLTVQEYLEASRWKRFAYRLNRNPFVLFVMAPLYLFFVHQRFPSPQATPGAKRSVWWTNLAIVAMAFGMSRIFGIVPYLLLQVSIMAIAGSAGVWLFYVQHQFEDAYWERSDKWEYTAAALRGSSFYKLPRVLQWFSGNIGFHHIHHLSPRIPNYHLQRCHESDEVFQEIKPITLFGSLKTMSYRLWDESAKQLIGFRRLRELRRQWEANDQGCKE